MVPPVGGKRNHIQMLQPLLMLGSETEPGKLVFTIEDGKLASADEVRVAIGREWRQYREVA